MKLIEHKQGKICFAKIKKRSFYFEFGRNFYCFWKKMIFARKRRDYLDEIYRAHRNHWNHVRHRIVGKPISLVPKHTSTVIVFRLLTLVSFMFHAMKGLGKKG